MSRLILHRGFGSPPARAVVMLSDLIGLQMEIKEVNLLHMEHRTPQFMKLNPMGTVPVLQDGDFVLSESHAIMKYLLEQYGGELRPRLYPADVRSRAVVDQCMFFDAAVFFPALAAVGGKTLFGSIDAPTVEQVKRINSSYSVLEAYLQNRKYVAADHLTLADLSNGATATAIQVMHKVDPEKYPRCADWLGRLQDERVFQTINAPGVAFFAKLITKLWEKNRLKNKQ